MSQKLSEPAPARLLYRSQWFIKVRTLVETQKADWLIRPPFTAWSLRVPTSRLMKRPSIALAWLSAALGQKMSADSWLRVYLGKQGDA